MIHIEICKAPEDLLANVNAWDGVAGGIPFRQSFWLHSWWQQFGDPARAYFLLARDEDDVCRGILPLERSPDDLRRLQTIAAGNVCTDHVSLLVNAKDRDEVIRGFANHLLEVAGDREFGWDQIDFDGTVAGDPTMESFLRCLQDFGNEPSVRTRMNVWFNRCEPTWDDLLTKRSRKYRHRVRRLLKQLDESDGELFVRDVSDPNQVHEGLSTLVRLHQQRWEGVGEPGTYADPRLLRFVTNATLEMSERGRLLLPQLVYRGEVIATELHYIGDDQRQYCYSTGVNHAFPELKPGILLNSYMFREAHRHGRAGIDYMRGDETYKSRLHSQPIPLLEITLFAKHARGQMRRAQDHATQMLKVQWRKMKELPQSCVLNLDEAFRDEYREYLPDQSVAKMPLGQYQTSSKLPVAKAMEAHASTTKAMDSVLEPTSAGVYPAFGLAAETV
ncbi:GNAT family N-acetyltransferase [Rhodopirellula halodulae]|uniref:GNAT family N-acetyltransferase n=1 Tax=Rhodopirellula halodulae TaxID=2894198 RepID=UPI001E622647|nr:GNAT family N-acetyltransferase [Rhodopirellula sp. JC737]MCC9656121.1 GNAT family N-acetyltransferase [Rhodopirellula sp. JC737]